MDVHEPYPWRAGYRTLFDDGAAAPEDFGNLRLEAPDEYARGGSTGRYSEEFAARLARLENDYDASLLYLDERIGEVMNFLEERKLLSDTLIVFGSDHGQEFGEHGNVGHCLSMYHEQTRVPLIIVGGGMPAGTRVRSTVRNLDIMPTVGAYIGLYPRSHGQDLLGVALETERLGIPPDREVFACSESDMGGPGRLMKMLISPGRVKYIITEVDAKVVREELYDLVADPDERRDLSSERPDDLAAMRLRMDEVYSDADAGAGGAAGGGTRSSTISPAIAESLRALGYLQ